MTISRCLGSGEVPRDAGVIAGPPGDLGDVRFPSRRLLSVYTSYYSVGI